MVTREPNPLTTSEPVWIAQSRGGRDEIAAPIGAAQATAIVASRSILSKRSRMRVSVSEFVMI
jgi:hypothetical protein